MKKLSDKELKRKIDSFLDRKNAEVFHKKRKQLKADANSKNNFAAVRYA